MHIPALQEAPAAHIPQLPPQPSSPHKRPAHVQVRASSAVVGASDAAHASLEASAASSPSGRASRPSGRASPGAASFTKAASARLPASGKLPKMEPWQPSAHAQTNVHANPCIHVLLSMGSLQQALRRSKSPSFRGARRRTAGETPPRLAGCGCFSRSNAATERALSHQGRGTPRGRCSRTSARESQTRTFGSST